jgi:hypothetical protein
MFTCLDITFHHCLGPKKIENILKDMVMMSIDWTNFESHFLQSNTFWLEKKYCDFCVDHGNLTSGYVNDKGVRYGIA